MSATITAPAEPTWPDMACLCYADPLGCVCGTAERALRSWAYHGRAEPMTKEQRDWCLSEIASVEGYERSDCEGCDSAAIARGVLSAWTDYARDKGLL